MFRLCAPRAGVWHTAAAVAATGALGIGGSSHAPAGALSHGYYALLYMELLKMAGREGSGAYFHETVMGGL